MTLATFSQSHFLITDTYKSDQMAALNTTKNKVTHWGHWLPEKQRACLLRNMIHQINGRGKPQSLLPCPSTTCIQLPYFSSHLYKNYQVYSRSMTLPTRRLAYISLLPLLDTLIPSHQAFLCYVSLETGDEWRVLCMYCCCVTLHHRPNPPKVVF